MTFQAIRAHIETSVNNAYQALSPAVPVVFDNVQETPPDLPYVVCLVSYTETTVTTVCVTDGAMEQLNGNLQLDLCPTRAGNEEAGGIRRRGDEGDEWPLRLGWRGKGQGWSDQWPRGVVRWRSTLCAGND